MTLSVYCLLRQWKNNTDKYIPQDIVLCSIVLELKTTNDPRTINPGHSQARRHLWNHIEAFPLSTNLHTVYYHMSVEGGTGS